MKKTLLINFIPDAMQDNLDSIIEKIEYKLAFKFTILDRDFYGSKIKNFKEKANGHLSMGSFYSDVVLDSIVNAAKKNKTTYMVEVKIKDCGSLAGTISNVGMLLSGDVDNIASFQILFNSIIDLDVVLNGEVF